MSTLWKKNIESNKVTDLCHLTGKNRGPAHSICNINVTQKRSKFVPIVFHNSSNYDCHRFYKELVDKNNDKVKFDIIPKTNEEYISVTYGCIRFINSNQFLSSSLDSLVKTLVDNSHETLKNLKKEIVDNDEILNKFSEKGEEDRTFEDLKKDYSNEIEKLEEVSLDYTGENKIEFLKTEFPDRWRYLTRKLAYPYEIFNCIEDYQKSVDNLKKEDFFSNLKIKILRMNR